MNAEIANLEDLVARRRSELQALLRANEALKARCATLQHVTRVLQEIRAHREAVGEGGSDEIAHIERLVQGALGGAAGGAAAAAAAASAGVVACSSLLHLDGVTRDEVVRVKQLDATQFRREWAALVQEASALLPAAGGGGGGSRSRGGGSKKGGDGAADGGGCGGEGAGLHDVGLRMARLHALMSLSNYDVYMEASSSGGGAGDAAAGTPAGSGCQEEPGGAGADGAPGRAEAPEAGPAAAGGGVAAAAAGRGSGSSDLSEEAHWDQVLERVRLTRMQALLLLELLSHHGEQEAALAAERARMASQLQALAAAQAAQPGSISIGDGSIRQVALVEGLDVNVKRGRTAGMVAMQVLRAVLTPSQWATWMCLSPSWPPGATKCGAALEKALAREPSVFADNGGAS